MQESWEISMATWSVCNFAIISAQAKKLWAALAFFFQILGQKCLQVSTRMDLKQESLSNKTSGKEHLCYFEQKI